MASLKSKKSFPFRNFSGRQPTVEELRQEIESMYEFLVNQVDEAIEELRAEAVPEE
jgi:hypothetical protein